ncbi:MAG: methyltransferase domain-containing protein [Geminicoccaceae bacterium]
MRAVDLCRRSARLELLDIERADSGTIEACLRDLERINRWTGAYRVTLRWLDQLRLEPRTKRPVTVLDAGCGGGDMLRRIAAWARVRRLEVQLIGVDLNPHATAAAAAATPDHAPIRYLTADLFDVPPDLAIDLVVSALFAHHLDDVRLVRFLRWMEHRTRLGWLINDLHRHRVPWLVAHHGARLSRMHRFVRHDAPLSVARAFDRRDWRRLLEAADLAPPAATVVWRFPFRFAVGRIKAAC